MELLEVWIVEATRAEDVAFDVAAEAASVEELRKTLERVEAELAGEDAKADKALRDQLETRKARLQAEIEAAEEQRANSDETK